MLLRSFAALTFVSGIVTANAQTALPENDQAFRALVLQHAALGSPINSTKVTAEGLGLACTWAKGREFWGLAEPTDYFYCSKISGSPVARRWQLALIPRGQVLHDVRATFGLVGP